jgi:hypothetical protein
MAKKATLFQPTGNGQGGGRVPSLLKVSVDQGFMVKAALNGSLVKKPVLGSPALETRA